MVGTSVRPWSIVRVCNLCVLQGLPRGPGGLPVPQLAVQPQEGGA